MKKLFYALILMSLAFSGCQPSHSHEAEEIPTVHLNGGKKWIANPETTEGILSMQRLATNFGGSHASPNLDDFHQLGEALQSEFDDIFRQCTMKGEAHNQLHNYLMPISGYLKVIKNGGRVKDIQDALQSLSIHLEEYGQYFE